MVTTDIVARQQTRTSIPAPVQRRLFSAKDAAAILGLDLRTVRRMLADGRLDSIKLGFNRFVTPDALRGYLAEAWLNPETKDHVEELLRKPTDPKGKEPTGT